MIDTETHPHLGPAADLGRGWSFPPRWHDGHIEHAACDVCVQPRFAAPPEPHAALVAAVTDIEQAIRIILGTAMGERVTHPEFGSRLRRYVFEPLAPRTYNLIASEVQRALVLWERRIMDIDVVVTPSAGETGRLDVNISYRLDTHRMRQNLVYPFYLRQPERQ